jgi:Flp pilus assembly protein CpaB
MAQDHPGAPAVPSAERPSSRRLRRLTTGSVVPVVLAVLAGGFAFEALQDRSAMTDVVVASSVVPAGAPVDPSDTRVIKVHTSDTTFAHGLLTPSALEGRWVTAVPLQAGEPITRSEIQRPAAGPPLGEMSIAVPLQQAAGGTISTGDLVDVVASNGPAGAYYVAQGLRVLGVAPTTAAGGVLDGGTTSYFIVVAVGKQIALKIAAALGAQGSGGTADNIEIVRSTGETQPPPGGGSEHPPGRKG